MIEKKGGRDGLNSELISFAFSTGIRLPNLVASPKNSSYLLSGLKAEALRGRFYTSRNLPEVY